MNKIGFIGLGLMGAPMALNIARAGFDLMVYNRTPGKTGMVEKAGAKAAQTSREVVNWADVVIMMLTGPEAVENILGPVIETNPEILTGKTIVNMGTNPPSYSTSLSIRLEKAGAAFVDAPVSGTRVPAEEGALLIMASGPEEAVEKLSPLFNAVGNKVVKCGAVPKAGLMKLAVNIVLSASISGLVEGAHFTNKSGLDLETFFKLILEGPLGNGIFTIKAKKMMEQDYSPQASIGTVREMLKHITDAAYEMNARIPNTMSNSELIASAVNLGLAEEDACALIKVFDN